MSDLNIKCYDNGGRTFDRYTIVYLDYPERSDYTRNTFQAVGCSEHPFHPQGFGQHTCCEAGLHLGEEVEFDTLPEDVKKLVHSDLCEGK